MDGITLSADCTLTDNLEEVFALPDEAEPCGWVGGPCSQPAEWRAQGHGCGRIMQWCDQHYQTLLDWVGNGFFSWHCDEGIGGCGVIVESFSALCGVVWRI